MLFFLEQYTEGQAKDLVKSCQYMDSKKGFLEAKRLLQENYGHQLLIAAACLDKMLNWNAIKSEDRKALHYYAIFLRGCCNTMEDVEFLDEINSTSNMRNVIMKLPFKLREKWRTTA